ncbi:hypothetical protein L1049_020959 [Liquidambar formosana]|uniref:RRM domain-containing protein n=1 Tax=Liquidambar formosana TaxID=63359 RepID=A0AAP0S9X6_LIQFO
MEGNSILSREVIEEEKKMDTIVMEVNSNLNGENVIEKGDVASEEREKWRVERMKVRVMKMVMVLKWVSTKVQNLNSVEEETPASHFEELKALEEGGDILDVKEGGDGEGEGKNSGDDEEASEDDNEEENEDDEEDEDPSEFIHDSLTDRKIQKDLEIYIGGLDKGAVEEDLINIFGKFGEIQEARIVKNSTTKKSKGFAFIRYATVEQTKNALSELKDGIEVRGKHVKISASRDNDTLYMGNICNTWTKEKILETLKGFGIEQIEEITITE